MIPVAVTSPSDFAPASSKEFLDIQATIECGFTLKRVCDMTRTYSQMHHTDKYSEHRTSLAKWLSVRLRTMWFWVRFQLHTWKYFRPGFKLTFQSCIVKKSCKISLVLVSPECAPWLGLRDRKSLNVHWSFACYRLLENAFSNVHKGI